VRRLFLLLLSLLLFSTVASAQLSLTAYRDVVLSSTGTPLTTAAITVFLPNTTTKPPGGIFSTALGGSLSNPFSVDSLGNYTFYAIPGVYDILISVPGLANTTIEDVHLASSSSYLLTGSSATPSGCTVGEFYYDTTTGLITFCGAAGISVPGNSTLTGNITFGGSILPVATGQDIGSATNRPDVFLELGTFYNTFAPDVTGVDVGTTSARPDAFLEVVTTGTLNRVRVVDPSGQFTTIAAAIAASSDGDEIFIPCGTFVEKLTINIRLHMRGSGVCTIIKNDTTSGPGIDIDGSSHVDGQAIEGFILENMVIWGADNSSGNAVTLTRVNRSDFRNLFIPETGAICFDLIGSLKNTFQNVHCSRNLLARLGLTTESDGPHNRNAVFPFWCWANQQQRQYLLRLFF